MQGWCNTNITDNTSANNTLASKQFAELGFQASTTQHKHYTAQQSVNQQ